MIVVDWSAAAVPVTGANSIWIAALACTPHARLAALLNLPTRAAATAWLCADLAARIAAGERVLLGVDFAFGYPAGTARRLGWRGDGPAWAHTWGELARRLTDRDDNRNDRFALGAALNAALGQAEGPFWGVPRGWSPAPGAVGTLGPKAPRRDPGDLPPARHCETRVSRAQPVWKLAYTGSVGSQALTGIPRLAAVRADPMLVPHVRLWPFDTGLAAPPDTSPLVVLCEVYPSLVPPAPLAGLPKDAGQVVALAAALAHADRTGQLPRLFTADPNLGAADVAAVVGEEGWILGVTQAPDLPPAPVWPDLGGHAWLA